MLLHKGPERLLLRIETDPHHLQAVVFPALVRLLDFPHLIHAGRAPGRPEVEQDHLALECGEIHFAPIQRGEAEDGRGFSFGRQPDACAHDFAAILFFRHQKFCLVNQPQRTGAVLALPKEAAKR